MTNGLFSLFSSLIANTPPPYRKGLSSRKFLSLFLILFLAVGNAWGDKFTASEIVANSGKGTTKNNVTVHSPGITTTSSQTIWKDGSTSKKEAAVVISADASNSDLQNRSGSYIEIIADEGYTLGTTINIRGGAKNSSAKIAPVVWWEETVSSTIDGGKFDLELPSNAVTSSSAADLVVTIPSGMKVVRIYRKVRLNKTEHTTFVTSNYDDIGGGSAAIVSIEATAVGLTPVCPSGLTISSKDNKIAFTEGDAIELTAALSAGNGDISYQWYKGSVAPANAISGATNAKYQVASCTTADEGDYFCVASKTSCDDAVNAAAFTITVAADTKCFNMPAITSKPSNLASVTVTGGTLSDISVNGKSVSMDGNGLKFGGNDSRLKVTLTGASIVEGTKITVAWKGASAGSAGVGLFNENLASQVISISGGEAAGSVSHTFTAEEAANYADEFIINRNASGSGICINAITVEDCGPAVTYHNVTSAVDPADKGTVTLGASSVREGKTTTAEYSDIDPLYEFVNWTVSGAGASVADATANPATITVGTEDAVVTLNLRLIPVKFTVNYFDGATAMGTEQVVVNDHPTASEIETAKRGYVFEGWAMSSTATASDVVALNTITSDVETAIPLYAIYTAVPCVSEGTVFSMTVTDPAGTQYEENNDFGLEIGATYLGGKAYSGSKSTTKRIGEIDTNGEYSFNKNSDVAVKVALDCALQEGDVIIFTTSTKRELKIKKVVGTDLVTTSSKKYTIPAESPLIGEYDFYLMRDNSESTFKTLKVERPYTISFDMQRHGDAIEAQKLIAGDKVVEPTAPTADGWDFKGWYKESACTNAWDFESDVVAGTMALYAKWDVHVTNDATLKSLKYGSEAIALADGVFEYNIGLPALTASVPTLTAVANSVTVHSLDIVDAAAFDVDGKATSTVTVVSEDETVTNVYTVNFAKGVEILLQDVTGSITWNFANAVTANVSITGTPQVLANYAGVTNDNTFESDKLEASGEKFTAGSKANLRANYIHFHTTVPGMLTISYSNTGGSNPARYIYVNGAKYDEDGSANTTPKGADNKVFVPAGDVELVMMDGEDASKNVQIYQMIFNANPDYTRTGLTVGSLGTICLPSNVPAGYAFGATFYELVGKEPQYGKIVFDEILSDELVAGKPYLFQAQSDVLYCFYGATSVTEPINTGAMKGTFVDLELTELSNIYYFAQKALWSCVDLSSLSVPANRAYVDMDDMPAISESNLAPGVRRITLGVNGQQVATGVDQVQGDEVPTKMIINGQLFILRGEKMYDAQGKLVK